MLYQTLPAGPWVSTFLQEPAAAVERGEDRNPLSFRHFVVLPAARTLLHRGVPVEIGGRAFDLLLVLLGSRGAIVAREEIMRRVWPGTFVEEGNLRYQMAMLRKLLGNDRDLIKTVTGRGYLFVDEASDVEVRRSRTVEPARHPLQAVAYA